MYLGHVIRQQIYSQAGHCVLLLWLFYSAPISQSFYPEKKKILDHAMETKTAVKLTSLEISQKYGITNIVVNKKTKITSINGPLTFDRIDRQNTTVQLSTITSIMQGQLINIKASIHHISGHGCSKDGLN